MKTREDILLYQRKWRKKKRDKNKKYSLGKQTEEHIDKRVNTRIKNNSYKGQNLGHKPTNLKSNSGSFKKGKTPWNKGLTKEKDNRVKNNAISVSIARKNNPKVILARSKQVVPFRDSSIEVKIQNFLKELNINFIPHKYVLIEHAYQCDIYIPSINLIIECDGNYWHNYPYGKEIDKIRTKELKENGYKIIRLWETEINILTLEKFRDMIISLT